MAAPQAQGNPSFAPQRKPGPGVAAFQCGSPSPVMAVACQAIARPTRSSSSQPKPMRARSRLPVRQWRTTPGGGGFSLAAAEHANPPVRAWLWASTYAQPARTCGSSGSAPSWSRKISDQVVPRYFGP